jgi:hypothetical protein
VIFGTFSTDSKSASNFAFHDTGIKFFKKKIIFLIYHFLLTLKLTSDKTIQKNEKGIL